MVDLFLILKLAQLVFVVVLGYAIGHGWDRVAQLGCCVLVLWMSHLTARLEAFGLQSRVVTLEQACECSDE